MKPQMPSAADYAAAYANVGLGGPVEKQPQ